MLNSELLLRLYGVHSGLGEYISERSLHRLIEFDNLFLDFLDLEDSFSLVYGVDDVET